MKIGSVENSLPVESNIKRDNHAYGITKYAVNKTDGGTKNAINSIIL